MTHTVLLFLSTLVPIFLFLLILIWMDSFTLIKKSYLLLVFTWGIACALMIYLTYPIIEKFFPVGFFFAPIVEELMKGLAALWMIKTKRSAFFIDALIYGAAIGAGFSAFENIVYVVHDPEMTVGTALIRGIITAIMHCGAVASTSAILSWFLLRKKQVIRFYPVALLPAIALHILNNSLVLSPYFMLPLMLFGVTGLMIVLILYNERGINRWMNLEIDSEINQLVEMKKGNFTHSKAGEYMLSIQQKFNKEVFFDMYCYVHLYWELSLMAKRNLILQDMEMEIPKDDEIDEKIDEFWILRKRIGKTGEMALAPIIQIDRKFYWKLELLKQK